MKRPAGRLCRGALEPYRLGSHVHRREVSSELSTAALSKTKKPYRFWKEKSNVLEALSMVEQKLGINTPEDWFTVTLADLSQIGFSRLSKTQLVELLRERYPHEKWERLFMVRGRLAQQRRLEKMAASLFPDVEMKVNARKEADLRNPQTGDYLELDIYIPALRLAFEYQERHHYTTSEYTDRPLTSIQERDIKKIELASSKGITVIVVPCWWDGTANSLAATIKTERPDLLQELQIDTHQDVIPAKPPPGFFEKRTPTIADIGQPTTACFFTLSNVDPKHWWVFEKFDGLRGFWNPLKKAFYSRIGNKLPFPQEVISAMPDDIFLDGEIWFGRDSFQEAIKISNRVDFSHVNWDKFRYMVYDVPTEHRPYRDRHAKLVDYFQKKHCKYVEVAQKQECQDMQHLEKFFQDVIDKGGEGIILRDPEAGLQPGRSAGYLKHKKYRDAEAKIIQPLAQHQWECQLPNGIRFTAAAATSEFDKRWNPQPGDIVSFKHHGFLLSTKKPKFPTIYRVRTDLKWEDVVNNWQEKKPSQSGGPIKRLGKKRKPKGYWKYEDNTRNYFVQYANEMGFDPFVASNWEKLTVDQFAAQGRGPLNSFRSFRRSLEQTFPELTFNWKEKKPKHHWHDVNNLREYFDNFAKQRGFDPLVAENWYSVPFRRAHSISATHGGMKAAIQKAYPEVSFTKWGPVQEKLTWQDPEKCRAFFDHFAKRKGFDPLQPENWYTVHLNEMLRSKGGQNIKVQNGGFRKALQMAFPTISFERWPSMQL